MRCILFIFALLSLCGTTCADAQDPTGVIPKDTRFETFEFAGLGLIHMLVPEKIKSVAIFADGDGGWNDGIADMAQLLANEGALVAGVDTPSYLHSLDSETTACATPGEDFVGLARTLQEKYSSSRSFFPILVGYSSGATLVYAVLAQAPERSFGGAITLGFCDTLEIKRPLCAGRALALHHSKEGLALFPTRKLGAKWNLLQGEIDEACTAKEVAEFRSEERRV